MFQSMSIHDDDILPVPAPALVDSPKPKTITVKVLTMSHVSRQSAERTGTNDESLSTKEQSGHVKEGPPTKKVTKAPKGMTL